MNGPRRAHGAATTKRLLSTGVVTALVASLLTVTASSASGAPIPPPDGLTEATAAASCWEIKQLTPSAPSGVYWLTTPALRGADQFYCDQTTDGGGWVLVGRGRQDWSGSNEGQGTRANVRDQVTGPAAFAPRQLSSETIAGLLNGQAVSSLSEGVRLRRATNTSGTSWQEVRFKFSSPRVDWSWQFNSQQRVGSWSIGSLNGSGGTTESFGSGLTTSRVQTTAARAQGWVNGFGFGSGARGDPDADSYVWATSTTAEYPRPFTQVFLRPRLMSTSIMPAIPDTGTAAYENREVASSLPLPTTWGVTGLGASGTGIQNTEVSTFAEIDGYVYVGGNFRYVQRNSSGLERVEQSYLAAFDVATGAWVSTFRPTFDDQVKSIVALPDGRLAVGGNFSEANGEPASALVVLDPKTGATSESFRIQVINYTSGEIPRVRSLDVQGGYLYVGGAFTHMTGGTNPGEVYTRNIGRLSVTDGTPDGTWAPTLNGTVISLDASAQGDRVYAAGYFGQGDGANRAGAFTTDSSAAIIPWYVDFSNLSNGRIGYQQAVKEVGSRVWLGGSEHMLFSYDRASMAELSTNITLPGGDFQAISADGDNVYAGCHCEQSVYEGARKWPSIGNAWTRHAKINWTGVWDAGTGRYVADFSPVLSTREGAGTWAIFTDSRGVTWMGGDFTYARRDTINNRWTGSFVRFADRDGTAPTTPGGLQVGTIADKDELTWQPSTDTGGSVRYQVLRVNRVVATTSSTTATLPAAPDGTKYFVRAVDLAGNLSASTPAAVSAGTAVQPVALVAAGSAWSYYFGADAPASGWQSAGFDEAGWSVGAAPLGWGHANLGTTLTAPGTRPLASYYRKVVQVADATKVASVTLTTRADDGVVVYVNGTEVGRANVPAGPVGHTSYASSAVSASNAVANPVTIVVPGSLFVTGDNVISAQVQSNYRSTPSASFELTATIGG